MIKFLKALWTEDKAENMPEYALLLFLICLATISTVGGVATRVNKIYFTASIHMTTASDPSLSGAFLGYTAQAPSNSQPSSTRVSQQVSR